MLNCFDVIIVGSGIAGLSTAINSADKGLKVAIFSKNYLTASNSIQAMGGINSAIDENDIDDFIDDIKKGAKENYSEEAISFLAKNSIKSIKWLNDIGVIFDNKRRKLGGSSKKRANFSSDFTGLRITQTLIDNVISHKNIEIFEDFFILDLIVSNDKAIGVIFLDLNSSKILPFFSQNIVLATGGYSSIYYNYTTNSKYNSGDGVAIAIKNNVDVIDLDLIQFHPTALKDKFILISEASRSLGAKLINNKQERFVDELQTRDIVSKAIIEQLKLGNEVFLDFRDLDKDLIMTNLNQEYKLLKNMFNLDITKDLIPVVPAAHFSIGGIKVDINLQTNLKNLYSVGEVSSNKVHGINRLGGNSLLECVVFGRHLGLILEKKDIIKKDINYDIKLNDGESFYKYKKDLGKIMYENYSIYKKDKDIIKDFIKNLDFNNFRAKDIFEYKELIEFKNMVTIIKKMVEK